MTENEVNKICREWLTAQGYKYKGVLHTRPKQKADENGYGQVPVPDGTRTVLIDHQGVRDRPPDLIWIEAKGSDCGMSQLLEGFTRVAYACYHGGGRGLLAVPHDEFKAMKEQAVFLRSIGVASERELGLLDANDGIAVWLHP